MTEKNYNPEQGKKQTMKKQEVSKTEKAPAKEKKETKPEEKKIEKKPVVKKEVVKKDEAVVNGVSVPVSLKDAIYICKFIKKKPIMKAVGELEEVLKFKRAIPMKGEIPHRKGKRMMSGRYPIEAVKHFVRMLKHLNANSNVNGLIEPIIAEAIANKAYRPRGRFGAVERKRAHIKIVAREKKVGGKKKIKENKH